MVLLLTLHEDRRMSDINIDYINSLIDKINASNNCEDLQANIDFVMERLNKQMQSLADQLAKASGIAALLEVPTNPVSAVLWIKNFIENVLQPMYQPYLTAIAQIAALANAIQDIINVINLKLSTIQSCSISIPTIDIPSIEP